MGLKPCAGSSATPHVVSQVTLPASSTPFILVPSTFFPQQLSKFHLRLRSAKPVTVRKVDTHYCTVDEVGEWKGKSAGGYQQLEANPQFTLTLTTDCIVHIFLEQLPGRKVPSAGTAGRAHSVPIRKPDAKAGRRAAQSRAPTDREPPMSDIKGRVLESGRGEGPNGPYLRVPFYFAPPRGGGGGGE